ncbi:UNVERIFIED_CONTAM: hypothetical protein ABIC26_003417 [Paenibacillus sp. PvR008]
MFAAAYTPSGQGHAYVIVAKSGNNAYTMYDPWTEEYLTKSSYIAPAILSLD